MKVLRNVCSESLLPTMIGEHDLPCGIVGHSRAVAEMLSRIELVSSTRSTVLITGETGTGKELVARAVHNRSAQRDLPFIKVNCAAIPETLLESELFGHVRGAFTDASGTRRGKFSLANRGSIFLDEIGTMSVGLQAKLLRGSGGGRDDEGSRYGDDPPVPSYARSNRRRCHGHNVPGTIHHALVRSVL